jgi:uncharacterized protein YukE
MSFDVNLTVTFASPKLEELMGQINDELAALKQHVADADTRVKALAADLKQQISDLQAQVAAGGSTPEVDQAFTDLNASVDAIGAAVPPPPTPPAP